MVATVRNLTSSSATSEYFRQDGGYYVRKGGDAADLRAKRAEHRNASAWYGKGAVALGLHPGKPVVGRRADWTPIGALTSCFLLTHRGQHRALNNTLPLPTSQGPMNAHNGSDCRLL